MVAVVNQQFFSSLAVVDQPCLSVDLTFHLIQGIKYSWYVFNASMVPCSPTVAMVLFIHTIATYSRTLSMKIIKFVSGNPEAWWLLHPLVKLMLQT